MRRAAGAGRMISDVEESSPLDARLSKDMIAIVLWQRADLGNSRTPFEGCRRPDPTNSRAGFRRHSSRRWDRPSET